MEEVKVNINCACKRKILEDEEKRRKDAKKLRVIEQLKRALNLGKRYQNASFEDIKLSKNADFNIILNSFKKYSQNLIKFLKKGLASIFGAQKAQERLLFAHALQTELIKNLKSVIFTSLFKISSEIKEIFKKNSTEKEQSILKRFSNADFLIFDDFGVEIFAKIKKMHGNRC